MKQVFFSFLIAAFALNFALAQDKAPATEKAAKPETEKVNAIKEKCKDCKKDCKDKKAKHGHKEAKAEEKK